jgi:hypothetical protein
MWGTLVFGELSSASGATLTRVIGGSLLMAAGAFAIALSSANQNENACWQKAAAREAEKYGIDAEYVQARLLGEEHAWVKGSRSWADWGLLSGAMAIIAAFAVNARMPQLHWNWPWMTLLVAAMAALLLASGVVLWRLTKFS